MSCIKAFFGISQFPDIDVSKEVLNKIAIDNTNKGFTVPGVQKKLSLHLSKEGNLKISIVVHTRDVLKLYQHILYKKDLI